MLKGISIVPTGLFFLTRLFLPIFCPYGTGEGKMEKLNLGYVDRNVRSLVTPFPAGQEVLSG